MAHPRFTVDGVALSLDQKATYHAAGIQDIRFDGIPLNKLVQKMCGGPTSDTGMYPYMERDYSAQKKGGYPDEKTSILYDASTHQFEFRALGPALYGDGDLATLDTYRVIWNPKTQTFTTVQKTSFPDHPDKRKEESASQYEDRVLLKLTNTTTAVRPEIDIKKKTVPNTLRVQHIHVRGSTVVQMVVEASFYWSDAEKRYVEKSDSKPSKRNTQEKRNENTGASRSRIPTATLKTMGQLLEIKGRSRMPRKELLESIVQRLMLSPD